ncbi:MAG: methyltransferase [Magnetococcales bacterium]|nr:methyltransferase [Magnetococcales bacterium]
MSEESWSLTRRLTLSGPVCRRTGGTVESQLLAAMIEATPGERLAELGAGCAATSLIVADRSPGIHLDALELQPLLVQHAQENVIRNNLTATLHVWCGNVRTPPADMPPGGYQQVFFNPPFFRPDAGRLPPDPVRAMARFEIAATWIDFVACAKHLLAPGGHCHMVHRPERWPEIPGVLSRHGLTPWRLFRVHPRPALPVALVLISATKGVTTRPAAPLQDLSLFLTGHPTDTLPLSQWLFEGLPLNRQFFG